MNTKNTTRYALLIPDPNQWTLEPDKYFPESGPSRFVRLGVVRLNENDTPRNLSDDYSHAGLSDLEASIYLSAHHGPSVDWRFLEARVSDTRRAAAMLATLRKLEKPCPLSPRSIGQAIQQKAQALGIKSIVRRDRVSRNEGRDITGGYDDYTWQVLPVTSCADIVDGLATEALESAKKAQEPAVSEAQHTDSLR